MLIAVIFCFTGYALAAEGMAKRKMLILGIDAMDPNLLQKYMEQGKLPNFKSIIDNGGDFKKLITSYPPQSPIAWSNFTIGANPGKHGIFDFIHRDPKTMFPYLSGTETKGSEKLLKFGKWQIPLSAGKVKNLREGKAFWEYLCERGIPVSIIKIPGNYPPKGVPEYKNLKALSGMGTPDILGTLGTFFYFTSSKMSLQRTIGGGKIYEVDVINGKVEAEIHGPRHPYKNPAAFEDDEDTFLTVGFTVWIDEDNDVAKIDINGQEIILNKGEFSDWIRIKFTIIPFFQSLTGIVRFYLKECHPDFKLYVSPVNIDPSNPAVPISIPDTYAKELFNALGYYYTQNMPPDTKALEHKIFSDDDFLKQVNIVFQEEEKRLNYELSKFNEGLLFHYFCVLDQICHTFWRTIDPGHPLYTQELAGKYGQTIENLYVEFDRIVGNVLKKTDKDTALIIMSDHGFTSYRRGVNLNTILLNNGYITLIEPDKQGEFDFFENVDWENTRAYNLGINAVYINLHGREFDGPVFEEDYDYTCEKIRRLLLNYVDKETGLHPVIHVARREEVYHGPYLDRAPDLIIGYNRNYRASWKTILGEMPKEEVTDNLSPWSGDHCMYSDLIPGAIVTNLKIKKENPTLMDIAPFILKYYNIERSPEMDGDYEAIKTELKGLGYVY